MSVQAQTVFMREDTHSSRVIYVRAYCNFATSLEIQNYIENITYCNSLSSQHSFFSLILHPNQYHSQTFLLIVLDDSSYTTSQIQ
jgi:hypothetical protein